MSVVLPLVIPALLLAIFRADTQSSFWDGLTVPDVAFGFAAVAMASIIRAVSLARRDWHTLIFVALAILLIEVGVGLSADTGRENAHLVAAVDESIDEDGVNEAASMSADQELGAWREAGANIYEAASEVEEQGDTSLFWFVSIAFGVAMVLTGIAYIVRVR